MVDWKRTLATLSTLTSRPQFYVKLRKQQYAKYENRRFIIFRPDTFVVLHLTR